MFIEQFDAVVPEGLQRDLVRSLFPVYETAFHSSEDYSRPTARKARPNIRVWNLEEALRTIAARYTNLITLEEAKNSNGSYWWPQLRIGGIVVLVASATVLPGEYPRHADFRQSLANENHELFPESDEGRSLFAILTHGDDREKHQFPAFAGIGIPARDYETFADYVPLFDRFRETVAVARGIRPEEVPTEAEVRRRIIARLNRNLEGA